MARPSQTNLPAGYANTAPAHFVNATGTAGKIVVDTSPASGSVSSIVVQAGGMNYAVPPVVTLSLPPPGGMQATAVARVNGGAVVDIVVTHPGAGYLSPPVVTIAGPGNGAQAAAVLTMVFAGGATAFDITATSADTINRDVQLYKGLVATTIGTDTGAAALTTQNTLSRTVGDFQADGYEVGNLVMLLAPLKSAKLAGVEGVLATVANVSQAALVVSSTPWANGAIPAGYRVVRLAPTYRVTVQAGAGTNGTTPSQGLLGQPQDGSAVRNESKLADAGMLIAALPVAVSANAYLTLNGQIAKY